MYLFFWRAGIHEKCVLPALCTQNARLCASDVLFMTWDLQMDVPDIVKSSTTKKNKFDERTIDREIVSYYTKVNSQFRPQI